MKTLPFIWTRDTTKKSTNTRRIKPVVRRALGIECLEDRVVLSQAACSIEFNKVTGVLSIEGGNWADDAEVWADGNKIKSKINCLSGNHDTGKPINALKLQKIVFRGGDGPDKFIDGTSRPSEAYGGDGSDTLAGGAGNDLLRGEAGSDQLHGGSGNDVIYGDSSGATKAQSGDDTMFGGSGNDQMFGGYGDDLLRGDGSDGFSGGNDTLHGGGGNDSLLGDGGDDSLFGGLDDDIVQGGIGFDQLFGEAGNDRLMGGYDELVDVVHGDDGEDQFFRYYKHWENSMLVTLESDSVADFESGVDKNKFVICPGLGWCGTQELYV